jgi:hypothetical protein
MLEEIALGEGQNISLHGEFWPLRGVWQDCALQRCKLRLGLGMEAIAMPVKNEKDWIHCRIHRDSDAGQKLLHIVSKTHRPLVVELELAIQQYKPQAVYKDNGK